MEALQASALPLGDATEMRSIVTKKTSKVKKKKTGSIRISMVKSFTQILNRLLEMNINPDVIVVGGGPVGLWTAIQGKLLAKDKEFLVIERNKEYQREDIRLHIEGSSLRTAVSHESLERLTKSWANKTIPIKDLENELIQVAHEVGIHTIHEQAEPSTLQQQYPTAKLILGADGARSSMREHFFGDKYWFNTPLQYLAQVRYRITIPEEKDLDSGSIQKVKSIANSYIKQVFAGRLVSQTISQEKNGEAQVSLRIFMDKETYEEMKEANRKHPYYIEKDYNKVPDSLRDTIIRWWGCNEQQHIIAKAETTQITAIQLTSYAAEQFTMTQEDGKVVALIGDAAQAYPFFRAINNGFLTGTKLAECIGKAFKQDEAKFSTSFRPYVNYAVRRAYIERISAFVKNLFVNIANLWLQITSFSSIRSVKFKGGIDRANMQRGQKIWEQLIAVN